MGSLIPQSDDDMEHQCGSSGANREEFDDVANETLGLSSAVSEAVINPSDIVVSSASADSQRSDSNRFFVARNSLTVDVFRDAVKEDENTDALARCPQASCRSDSDARAVRRSYLDAETGGSSLIFDTDEIIQVVFAVIDLVLIASRWCCLHATLHSGVVEPRPSPRSTGTGNSSTVSTASHNASSTAATAVMNGRSAATNDKASTTVNELSSTKDAVKSENGCCCCCCPGLKCRGRQSQKTPSKTAAASSSSSPYAHSPLTPDKYENWEGLMGDFQFVGNSPTSSSSSCAKHLEMAKLPSMSSSTSSSDFVAEMLAPEMAEAKSHMAANSAEDLLGRLTICAVTLVLIYVIVATFECMVREFAARSVSGIATDSDLWRMEVELHGTIRQQVCCVFFLASVVCKEYVAMSDDTMMTNTIFF